MPGHSAAAWGLRSVRIAAERVSWRAMKRLVLPTMVLSCGVLAKEVRYANEAAELLQGARLPAVAGVVLGLPSDPGGLGRSPAGLAEYEHPELVIHHAVLYSGLGATQDELLLAVPLQERVGLGVGLSRVGADGLLRVDEGETPDFENPRTFSASDWVGTLGLGRSWFGDRLLAGASIKFLFRDLDQYGVGAQTDASVVWKSPQGWRTGARLARGFGSFAAWESGREEFSPADIMIGAGVERRLPYFYGKGFLGWESPGLVQGEGSATFTDQDVRLTTDPWLFLRASRLGGEFQFDFGGVVRAGCEIQAVTRLTDFLQDRDEEGLFGESSGMVSFGAGYLWNRRVRVDYALVVDPDLGSMHRVAMGLVFGPVAPKGAGRPESEPVPPDLAPAVAPPVPLDSAPRPAIPVDDTAAAVAVDSLAPPPVESISGVPEQPGPESVPAVAPAATPTAPVAVPPAPPAVVPGKSDDDDWDAPEQVR